MKKLLLLAGMAMVAFTGCKKWTRTCFEPNDSRRVYTKSTRLSTGHIDTATQNNTLYYRQMADGHNTVFEYIASSDLPNAYDAGSTSTITFQADSGVTSFSYVHEEMARHLTHYTNTGGWGQQEQSLIKTGSISGMLMADGSWKVDINIALPKYDDNLENTGITETVFFK